MHAKACVFDAYGTLFDVAAAARSAAAEPGFEALTNTWPALAKDWRDKQLQGTWLRAVTGDHLDFWRITCDALDWAMEAAGLDDPQLRARLRALYWELSAFEEVPHTLNRLHDMGLRCAILSNGTPEMLQAAIAAANLEGRFEAVISVEEVGVFKPHPSVYGLVGSRLGLRNDEVAFVSSNGWDACCAAAFGLPSIWVNRSAQPAERLSGRPRHTIPDLRKLPDLIRTA